MQFLNPLFLIGAIAIALPIFLHLFQKEKKTSLRFSSLMFLRRLPVKQTRRRQLRHLLLLALRCLGFLLLVAAFARPVAIGYWLDRANPLASRSVVILLDRSLSVSQTAAWGRALQAAREEIGSLGEGDEGLLIQFGEIVEVLTAWEDSPAKLMEVLDSQVMPSYEGTSFVEGLRMAAEQLTEAHNGRKEVVLITDLQREGMGSDAGWKAPPDVTVEVKDIGEPTENLFIQQVRLDRHVFSGRYPNAIVLRLLAAPPRIVEGEVQLRLGGREIAQHAFQTNQNGSAEVTFQPFEVEEGITRGSFTVEFSDALPADNTFYFVVERRARQTVWLISDAQASFFLESALAAGENLPYVVERGGLPDDLDPGQTPLVFLNDVATPPSPSVIRDYLGKGGSVIVALGNQVRGDRYNEAWQNLLPVRLVERRFVKSGSQSFTSMTNISWEHPVFSIFQDQYRGAVSGAQFFGYWVVEPKPDATVFARFSDGLPALVESGAEKPGRLIVFCSDAGSVWSDFPLRSSYVPFWQSTVQYATSWGNKPAASRINQILSLNAWAEEQGIEVDAGRIEILDPGAGRILALDQSRPDFVRLTLPGHYELRGSRRTDWIAVNTPVFESDLETIPLEDFLAVFVPRESRSAEDLPVEEKILEQERQQGLWTAFLLLSALLFAIEPILANRARPRPA